MRRFLETLFRRKGIFLTPVLITPLVALAFLAAIGPQQEVTAALWVEPSPLFGPPVESGDSELMPNQVEAQALKEWLLTDAFRQEVVEQSGLGQRVRDGNWPRFNGMQQVSKSIGLDAVPLLGGLLRMVGLAGPANQDQAMDMAMQTVRQGVQVVPEGSNLMLISYVGNDSGAGVGLVNAVITIYQGWMVERRAERAQQAVEFQSQQVDLQQERVQAANAELNAFLATNPAPRPPEIEAEAERLRRNYEIEQSVYGDAMQRLGEVRSSGEAAVSSRGYGFEVIDPAQEPTSSGAGFSTAIMTLVLGGLIGAALGGAGIAMISWTDKTVRTTDDLTGLVRAPVQGQVPALLADNRGTPHMAWLIARGHGR